MTIRPAKEGDRDQLAQVKKGLGRNKIDQRLAWQREDKAMWLVAEAKSLAKARGFKRVGLAVNPDPRCPAHKLYLKLGYKPTGENKYVDGIYGGVKDWVVNMVKNM